MMKKRLIIRLKRADKGKARTAKSPKTTRTPANKGKVYPAEILKSDEIRKLIKQCSHRAPTGIRNAAMITVLYRTGIRCSEVLALKPSDIDADKGTLRVLHGKGNRARTVGMDDGAFAVLARWLDRRTDLGINGKGPVFCTLRGKPLKSPYVRELLPRLARKAGIDRRVHAHILRHTHASELLSEGVDIGEISTQLGHSSIATTARYLDHISPLKVIETMRKRTWVL